MMIELAEGIWRKGSGGRDLAEEIWRKGSGARRSAPTS